jgi:NAD(P)H dehydrogenase (quinone)
MVILLVFCHPSGASFSAGLLQSVRKGLEARNHQVIVRDLYAEGFSPTLSQQEFASYYDTVRNTAPVQDHVADLRAAEGIILIYPTWWYGMPAMLKGYLDRVWLPGVAFGLSPSGAVTTEPLRHIRRFMVVTTYGSPGWWIRHYLGDPGRKAVERGCRRLFSPLCRTAWLALYAMDSNTAAQRRAFTEKVVRALRLFDS